MIHLCTAPHSNIHLQERNWLLSMVQTMDKEEKQAQPEKSLIR